MKVKPGDEISGLSALEWNRHVDTSEWYHRNKANGEPMPFGRVLPTTGLIWIKNASAASRRQGEILKVGDYLPTSLTFVEYRQFPWFTTAIHDGTDAPLCVLLQSLESDEYGWAQISGVCPALVNFTHADQRYARPAASNDVLQADVLGQVRILYKPSGTGEKECMVDLNGGRYNGWGKPDSTIAKGSSGTVSFWNGLATAEADSTINCTAYAKGIEVTSAKIVSLVLMNNVLYVGCWES